METRQCIQCNVVRGLDRFAAKAKPKFHCNQPKIVFEDRMTDLEKQRRMRAMEGMDLWA